MEREQQLVIKLKELQQVEQIGKDLELIYTNTVLLCKEGRTTYSEVEKSFMEWQMILVEIESMKLDYEKTRLINFGNDKN